MLTRTVLLGSLALIVAAGTMALGVRRGDTAQQPLVSASPPTYDYDADTPGTQPPTSPLLEGFEARVLRTHSLVVTVLVPRAELQAILPPGFVAQGTANDPDAAAVSFGFFYQQQFERTGVGTFGPSSGLQVTVGALNTNTDPDRAEGLQIAHLLSDQPSVDAFNATYGPGSFRPAAVKVEIEEEEGRLRLAFDVQDAGLGLRIKAAAEGPAAIVNRVKVDPAPGPGRLLNNGLTPNPPFRIAVQSDNRSVPTAQANLQFETPDGVLRLPGGTLTITGIDANVSFARWLEAVNKFE